MKPGNGLEARPLCDGCGRALTAWVRPRGSSDAPPVAVVGACCCDRITTLPTRTRILLLQHPRERHVAIGTARMAHLALPNSRLRVGLDFASDPEVLAALAGRQAVHVLFPGPAAVPAEHLPHERDITLIVLDGTWWQARKLLRLNPAIAQLPRIAFVPRKPSAYLIRREPAEFCVSTIEALAEVLKVLEPEGDRFERLLDPFHAMVARQRWFQAEIGSRRHGRSARRGSVPPRKSLADRLSEDWSRLVCVHGSANMWPRRHPERPAPETIHWIAHRPSTDETFEAVLAPRRELAPGTAEHVELPADRLRAGDTLRGWHERWVRFTKPDDILVTWGTFYPDLAAAEGLPLPFPSVDLRLAASRVMRRRMGTIENSMTLLGAKPASRALPGRGGRRLAALVGALESLRAPATSDGSSSSAVAGSPDQRTVTPAP